MLVKLQFPCAYPHVVSTDSSKVVVVMCIHKFYLTHVHGKQNTR